MAARASSSPGRQLAGVAVAALVAVAVWWLAVGRDPATACRDDCQIQHAPALQAIGRAWLAGEVPLLDRSSWYGGELAAEHQYGVLSPAIALPATLAAAARFELLNTARLVVALHLAVLAAGAFLLARGRGLDTGPALLVAWTLTGNGYVLTWAATDWLPALTSIAWLPWILWALDRAYEGANQQARRDRWTVAGGLFLALLLLAGWPHSDAMAVLAIVLFAAVAGWRRRSWGSPARAALAIVLGLAIAAPALRLAAEAYRAGARSLWPAGDEGEWVVPLSALAGWLWPGVTTEWQVFLWRKPHAAIELAGGTLAAIGLLFGLLRARKSFLTRAADELGLLAVALALLVLPGLPAFRWSFRWIPLAALALALAGARGWQELRPTPAAGARGRWVGLAVAVLTAVSSILALGNLPQLDSGVRWGRGWEAPASPPLDPNRLYLSLFERADLVAAPESPAPRGGGLGLLPGALPLVAGGELVNGYSPFEPFALARLLWMRSTGEIHPARARVLLASEAGSDGVLAALGVSGLLIAEQWREIEPALIAQGWQPRGPIDGGVRFERTDPLPPRVVAPSAAACVLTVEAQAQWLDARPPGTPAWVLPCAPGESPGSTIRFAPATLGALAETRTSSVVDVAVEAGRPNTADEALVVFRRAWYPGLRARLDGRELPVVAVDLALPGVRVPGGSRGRVELDYAPSGLSLGGSLAALALLSAAVLVVRERHKTAS